ncbi:MAG: FAD binding domain-containing protein [Candidatus Cloacimonetes bacterium]|nr:FAD binding domain-containing protein [Candidatus Cloacimonadota bacterium]
MSEQDNIKPADLIHLPEGVCLYNRIRFYLNGRKRTYDIPPAMTTLDFVHRELGMYGTKCSCNEGDCGACMVVVVLVVKGKIRYQAINSCIYPAAKLHGKHLITVEGIGTPQNLHPIQTALLDHHGTQCGYCTPGFVMSIFAYLANGGTRDRESTLAALEGNLCRCTGYDSILRAVEQLTRDYQSDDIIPQWCRELEPDLAIFNAPEQLILKQSDRLHPVRAYLVPDTLDELFRQMEEIENSSQYRIICGGTDLMVQANVNKIYYPYLLDISQIEELNGISEHDGSIEIGATVTYNQLKHSALIQAKVPVLIRIIDQIASEQVRNSATLIGNIGNASPVADAATTLLALDARLKIVSAAQERYLSLSAGSPSQSDLDADQRAVKETAPTSYYLDYKQTAIRPGELIHSVIIPEQELTDFATIIKSTKRKAVDISSIVTAAHFRVSDGIIVNARLAIGGADRYPRLSAAFNRFCQGKSLFKGTLERRPYDKKDASGEHPSLATDWFEEAAGIAEQDFAPISDVRGSEGFRSRMIYNHALLCLQRCRDHFSGGAQ